MQPQNFPNGQPLKIQHVPPRATYFICAWAACTVFPAAIHFRAGPVLFINTYLHFGGSQLESLVVVDHLNPKFHQVKQWDYEKIVPGQPKVSLNPNGFPVLHASYRLKGQNYLQWAQVIRTTLKGWKKLNHTKGTTPAKSDSQFKMWDDEDSFIMTWLGNFMTSEITRNCMILPSAWNIWNNLRQTFLMEEDIATCYELKTKCPLALFLISCFHFLFSLVIAKMSHCFQWVVQEIMKTTN